MTTNQLTETKHTPGPWEIFAATPAPFGVLHVCKTGDGARSRIATLDNVHLADEHGGSIEANARLIASCPTMFAYIQKQAAQGDNEAQSIIDSLL